MLAQYGKVFHHYSQCDISNAVHLGIQCISETHYFILDEIWHTSIFVHLQPLKMIVAMKQRLPLWYNTKRKIYECMPMGDPTVTGLVKSCGKNLKHLKCIYLNDKYVQNIVSD